MMRSRFFIMLFMILSLPSARSEGLDCFAHTLQTVFENPKRFSAAQLGLERLETLDAATADEFIQMIKQTYGDSGTLIRNRNQFFDYDLFFAYRDPASKKAVAFTAFYETPYGLKSALTAHNGTQLGKDAARELLEGRFQVEGVYSEFSKKPAQMLLTHPEISVVDFKRAQEILHPAVIQKLSPLEIKQAIKDQILPDSAEIYKQAYKRTITINGQLQDEVKVMVGKPYDELSHAKLAPMRDSAVELETDLNEAAMQLITTHDGTIGPLLKDRAIPLKVRVWAAKKGKITNGQISAIAWDEAPFAMKQELLRVNAKDASFARDRTIRGLRPRSEVTLTFPEDTHFLGVRYPAGTHQINLKGFLGDKVEYGSPESVKALDWVEFHVRGRNSAGQVSNDAWSLCDGSGIKRPHQHVHIVSALPQKLTRPIEEEVLIHTEYFRRVNALAEMSWIVRDGRSLTQKVQGTWVFYAPLKNDGLDRVTNYFESALKGKALPGDQKIAWAGFRGEHTYDEPGLWGIEFRTISNSAESPRVKKMLDHVQDLIRKENHGMSPEDLAEWTRTLETSSAKDALKEAWWHPNESDLIPNRVAKDLSEKEIRVLKIKGQNALEMNYLYHDWSRDPLLYRSPQLKKIAELQKASLHRVINGEAPQAVVADFLNQSGIFKEYEKFFQLR